MEKYFDDKKEICMILVLLGTQHNEFRRLLQEIEDLIEVGTIKERVVVQAGYTKYKTIRMKIFDMISGEVLDNLIDEADIIITHGGVGSIIKALKKNKKVIAVPRLHKFGEHVNDHQRQIVEVFSTKKYLLGVQNVEDIGEALKQVNQFIPNKYESNNQKMINIIDDFINKI